MRSARIGNAVGLYVLGKIEMASRMTCIELQRSKKEKSSRSSMIPSTFTPRASTAAIFQTCNVSTQTYINLIASRSPDSKSFVTS